MNTTPYWSGSVSLPRFPKVSHDIEVDVVVIGAGVTGTTAAYLLKKSGKTVALLERGKCLDGDSGHTTAHLTSFPDMLYSGIMDHLGKEQALEMWKAGEEAIQEIAAIIAEESIECRFRWVKGTYCGRRNATPEENRKDIDAEVDASEALGIPYMKVAETPGFHTPGISYPDQALFHPGMYLAALLSKIPGDGCYVFEESPADSIDDDPVQVHVNGSKITAEHVIIATHNHLTGNGSALRAMLLQTKLALYSTYALSAKIPSGLIEEGLYWDTAEPYNYLRVEKDDGFDRAIFGGQDHKTGREEDTVARFAALEETFRGLVGGAEIDFRWSGQVIESNDGLPYIGEMGTNQFIGTAYSGNGYTLGTIAAKLAVEYVYGRDHAWLKLFSPKRKIGFSEVKDYIAENKDYPLEFLKRRVGVEKLEEIQGLRAGEGRVVEYDGQKTAICRLESGKLAMCSAICTHMKGVVVWNPAEQTWDCPCHGARYRATGEVFAGPAEDDLEPVDADEAERELSSNAQSRGSA